jgi:hypothetical protein
MTAIWTLKFHSSTEISLVAPSRSEGGRGCGRWLQRSVKQHGQTKLFRRLHNNAAMPLLIANKVIELGSGTEIIPAEIRSICAPCPG